MAINLLSNTTSLTAQRNLGVNQNNLQGSIQRLSSGLRINTASDDAAGLGISENLKADIRSLSQAQRNANDAISMSQVAEGAMNEMQGIVGRMRELAVQASNSTLGTTERGYIQTEFNELTDEIDRLSNVTEFNGQKLLDGSASAGLTMQIGIHNSDNDKLTMSIGALTSSSLGLAAVSAVSAATGVSAVSAVSAAMIGDQSLSTATSAQAALAVFDAAIQGLSTARARVGAVQSRMSIAVSNLATTQENLSSANARIREVDVASETANLTRFQILSQAGVAVLGQANQMPSTALSLLG